MSENVSEWVDSWQDVQESDIAKVGELLRQGGLSIVDGSILNLFEERFASYMGCKYGVAFSNGTTAIHYALRAVGVGPGDEVLVCNYGFHAMAAAVLALGARVVICDCDAQAMTISPDDIRRLKTAKTKAVLVHNPWGCRQTTAISKIALPVCLSFPTVPTPMGQVIRKRH
jgi:dTDP-4-amino-4,6-dideoxygalactose transaminase